ncbi:MAG: glycosyl transferase family 2 [Acidimicrobiales bacterium mtb01]|nr:glycosyltransferase family 2 protein [Actinomycetota bacterium]TEX48445.1 MAG: glycosyl transferase family 2 [Acidimicrobiales bacterium mtb01]
MPAYNAERTLERTFFDLPEGLRKHVLLVDDCSTDRTVDVAHSLGLEVIRHDCNLGYGANQKTCYQAALERQASVVVMLHPDYQYDSRVVDLMAELIYLGTVDFVLGNRIRTRKEALSGGMPKWKYFLNRTSTFIENLLLGQSIGDFHSGLRAYSRDFLLTIPFHRNSNDFAFDQEMIVQAVSFGFRIGDIPVPVRYMEEASSIGWRRSIDYGFGGLGAIAALKVHQAGFRHDPRFARS